jgi:hypothetical protein
MVGDEEASGDRSETSPLVFRAADIERLPHGTDRQHWARLVASIMAPEAAAALAAVPA